jgi:hypothetical protein
MGLRPSPEIAFLDPELLPPHLEVNLITMLEEVFVFNPARVAFAYPKG